MRDCPNAQVRDALPDLMHGTLPPQRLADVRAHVDGCDACRAELALLERVRRSVHSPAMAVDRIVAKLPAYRRRPAWRRMVDVPGLRAAAAVLVIAGGAALLFRGDTSPTRTSVEDTVVPRISVPVELAVGETFVGISDSALVSLVEAMEDLDAVLSEEPEHITVPVLPAEGL